MGQGEAAGGATALVQGAGACLGYSGALLWGGSHPGCTRAVAGGSGALSVEEGALQGSVEGPVCGEGRTGGEEGEARSTVLSWGHGPFPGPMRPVLGAAGSLGMALGTWTCAHPTLLVHCLLAVPGPCRPGLCSRHPARG